MRALWLGRSLATTSTSRHHVNFRHLKFFLNISISGFSRRTIVSKLQIERPTLDDVQRLSEGRAARSRGYGSRQIPHRLNTEERETYNRAKERGFLTLKGSGYRKERKGSPLANIYRQLSDADGRPCIIVQQMLPLDAVLVDVSTLRLVDTKQAEQAVHSLAGEIDGEVVDGDNFPSPFTVIVPEGILEELGSGSGGSGSDKASSEQSKGEQEEDVKEEISPAVRHVLEAPIWQQPPRIVTFRCERSVGKALAKLLATQLSEACKVTAVAAI